MPKERLWMGRSASHSLDWLSSGCQCRKFASNGVQDKVRLVSNDDCNSERKHGANVMAVKLNRRAFEFAKKLVRDGKVVIDDRDAWSEHQPSTQQENEFIRQHGFGEYAKWHLGTDDSQPEDSKRRYKFPYGDFEKVHRCGVLSAESRAGQYKHFDVERAAAHLHGMIDELRERAA